MKRLRATVIGLIVTVIVGAALPASAAELDPKFSTDGKVITDVFGGENDYLHDVAVQPDGKIVAVGSRGGGGAVRSNFAMVRYMKDGELDTSFGANGRVLTDFDGSDDIANAVAIQPDGKIVVAGSAVIGTKAPDIAVARYRSDGSLDPTFSEDGRSTASFGDTERATDVLVQPNGSIVVVGVTNSRGSYDFLVLRYTPGGTLDPTFAGNGWSMTGLGGADFAHGGALQSDGKILVVGTQIDRNNHYDLALARYNTDGSLDDTFNNDGVMVIGLGGEEGLRAVAVQPNGKFVAVGYSSGKGMLVTRHMPDGWLDQKFAKSGRKWIDSGEPADAYGVAIQSDGKIVIGGSAGFDLAVARLNSTGSLDRSFAPGGLIETDFGQFERGSATVIQPDGRIVMAGYMTSAEDDADFVIARYKP